ncbi:hypothetical protein AB0I68_25365 [Streptomyces sp. NPDC050448]|uniref:hypothetical protein n=1 Tax=Streptomyces sp. NPDC050448 TaxID=3155404 RepID=UPI0034343E3F
MTKTATVRRTDRPGRLPSAGGRPGRRSSGPARLTGALLVVVSLIPALACGAVFTEWLPSDIKRYEDYAAAEPCPAPAPTTGTGVEDCLRTVPFTVEKTVVKKGGRNARFEATLSGFSGGPIRKGDLRFGNPGPLLEKLEPGDAVTATVWRGSITMIATGGIRQSSTAEPRDEAQMTAGIGTFTGLLAALGLGFAAAWLAGLRGQEPWTWRSLGKPLLIGMAITCFGVAYPAFLIGLPWWVVPSVAVPFTAYAAWQLHRYRRSAVQAGRAGSV